MTKNGHSVERGSVHFICEQYFTLYDSEYLQNDEVCNIEKTDETYIIKSIKYNRIIKTLKINIFVIAFENLMKCEV